MKQRVVHRSIGPTHTHIKLIFRPYITFLRCLDVMPLSLTQINIVLEFRRILCPDEIEKA